MIAIFKTGGKQYCVKAGQILKVEKIEGKKGDNFTFNKILALGDKSKNTVGTPLIKGASIDAKILDQIRGEKITISTKLVIPIMLKELWCFTIVLHPA